MCDDANSAVSPPLTAGKKYFLEGLLKQGPGDIYLNVAAKPSTSSLPAASLPVLSGNQISTFVNPDLGKVTFTQQPANATASAGSRAQFSVKVQADESPVYYQWRLNGVAIPGATRPTYITPVLATSDEDSDWDD